MSSKKQVEKQYGDWIVLKEMPSKKLPGGDTKRMVLCKCACGKQKVVQVGNLLSGSSLGCGCRNLERLEQWRYKRSKPDGEVNRKQVFKAYLRAAKNRDLSFLLSEDDFFVISQKDCYFCGRGPSNKMHLKWSSGPRKGEPRVGKEFTYNGVDRLDNNVGYESHNCVPCCVDCNRAKRDLTVQEFFDLISRVFRRHPERIMQNG